MKKLIFLFMFACSLEEPRFTEEQIKTTALDATSKVTKCPVGTLEITDTLRHTGALQEIDVPEGRVMYLVKDCQGKTVVVGCGLEDGKCTAVTDLIEDRPKKKR